MANTRSIAAMLPYLRRYARALTGNQNSGDAYVRATLQAIVDGESLLPENPSRTDLYKIFHRIWNATGAALDAGGEPTAPDLRLQRLTPRDRQAFLLTTMETFSLDEAADVLGVSVEQVGRDLLSAQADIDAALKTHVLIIEDEPIIALDIEGLVSELGHSIAGSASTRTEAVKLARETRPGLVLADIQLADGSSGIDAVKDILGDLDVPVIFITAFPERLLSGERPEPTYLITKPFVRDAVKAAIGQALFFHPAPVAA